jgi:uncharacterized membrane protein
MARRLGIIGGCRLSIAKAGIELASCDMDPITESEVLLSGMIVVVAAVDGRVVKILRGRWYSTRLRASSGFLRSGCAIVSYRTAGAVFVVETRFGKSWDMLTLGMGRFK